jgi:hypothetical protein
MGDGQRRKATTPVPRGGPPSGSGESV